LIVNHFTILIRSQGRNNKENRYVVFSSAGSGRNGYPKIYPSISFLIGGFILCGAYTAIHLITRKIGSVTLRFKKVYEVFFNFFMFDCHTAASKQFYFPIAGIQK